MGEAKRKAAAIQPDRAAAIESEFLSLGINPEQFGFYDSPNFLAAEKHNPDLLQTYGEWVVSRKRTAEYDTHVRQTVPKVASIVSHRMEVEGTLGACLNTAGGLSRMLDRLQVWSCVLRGSANIQQIAHPELGARYWWDIDSVDHPPGITGHAWVCAPPYWVVDVSLKHQPWGDEQSFGDSLDGPVVLEQAERIRPKADDVICHELRELQRRKDGYRDTNLHYRLKPNLAQISKTFGAWQADVGNARLRYVPSAVGATDVQLEDIDVNSGLRVRPIDIWNNEVAPAFAWQ